MQTTAPTLSLLESPPKKMEAISIGQLVFSADETKVIRKISKSLDRTDLSIGDFLGLNFITLANLNGIGATYLEQVPAIQAKLPLLGMRQWAALGHANGQELLINESALPVDTQKALEKLKRYQDVSLATPVAASTILSINLDSLASGRGWGGVSTEAICELALAISQQLGGLLDSEEAIPLTSIFQEGGAFTTAVEIDEHISSTIVAFLNAISEQRDREVLEVRLGLGRQQETLEQLGQRLSANGNEGGGITRERVRQIEKRQRELLQKSFFVSPADAISAGKPHPTSKLAHGLTKTAALFADNDTFLEFFAAWSDQPLETLRRLEPEVVFEKLFPFIASHASPYSEEDLIETLREGPDESAQSCREKILSLESAGFLKRNAEHSWLPSQLPIGVAVPHLFLPFEEGLHWKDAWRELGEGDLLGASLSKEQSFHNTIQSSHDLYLCGKGKYCHRKYHGLPDTAAPYWIRFLRSRLGENSENLRYWFHKQGLDSALKYHDLRDVLSRLGEPEGVYFNGKSQAETVSLTPNPDAVANDAVIIEFVQSHGAHLTRNEIKDGLPFIPPKTIDLQLSELVQAGEIVKVDHTHWGPADCAPNEDQT